MNRTRAIGAELARLEGLARRLQQAGRYIAAVRDEIEEADPGLWESVADSLDHGEL